MGKGGSHCRRQGGVGLGVCEGRRGDRVGLGEGFTLKASGWVGLGVCERGQLG